MSVINIEMGLNKTEFNSSAHRSQFQKTMKYKKPTCTKITFMWSLPTEGLFVSNCWSCSLPSEKCPGHGTTIQGSPVGKI